MPVHSLRELAHEVTHDEWDVLAPIAQRRNVSGNTWHPVVQIATKQTFFDHLFQIPVCRGDYAYIHLLCPRAPQSFKFMLPQNPQQFSLELERNISDFVQEQEFLCRPARSGRAFANGPGEGALFVPEQFTFQ